jgi:sugar phosphate isomerase/epimerase
MNSSPPVLPSTWKNRYAFRTGTTSFIFPAGYAENVDRLGPYLDEIELLMFESRAESRPDPQLVQELAALAAAHNITYNVHLPVDLDLTHPDAFRRSAACDVMRAFIDTLLPLDPSVFVLHLPPPLRMHDKDLKRWQRRASLSIAEMLQVGLPGRRLALENLFFPFHWLTPVLREHDLSVCLDTGHLALQKQHLADFLTAFGDRLAIMHLHGVQRGRDHQPLTAQPASYHVPLAEWLAHFQGTVSLEVFALNALRASLATLDEMMAPIR